MNERIAKQNFDFLATLPPKQRSQIALKMLSLFNDPLPHDSIKIKGGNGNEYRVDIGEYRILYTFTPKDGVFVAKTDKRNASRVYKKR